MIRMQICMNFNVYVLCQCFCTNDKDREQGKEDDILLKSDINIEQLSYELESLTKYADILFDELKIREKEVIDIDHKITIGTANVDIARNNVIDCEKELVKLKARRKDMIKDQQEAKARLQKTLATRENLQKQYEESLLKT